VPRGLFKILENPIAPMKITFQDELSLVVKTASGHEIRIADCASGDGSFIDIWNPKTAKEHSICEVAPDRVITLEPQCHRLDATIKL
jgi:hypothetical protein